MFIAESIKRDKMIKEKQVKIKILNKYCEE